MEEAVGAVEAPRRRCVDTTLDFRLKDLGMECCDLKFLLARAWERIVGDFRSKADLGSVS